MNLAFAISLALILDAIFGEPEWLWSRFPHPAVLIGRLIGWIDNRFNRTKDRKAKGIATVIFLVFSAGMLGTLINNAPFGNTLTIVIAAILLAQRSLTNHVSDVANALRLSLPEARTAVAKIVGRDTAEMQQSDIIRGAIESAAENLSDGVVAPVFWFLILGLPGLLIYKTINTADSMIGYKTPRHAEFGWAAARFDDLINWVPARLTALLIALAHGRTDILPLIRRDAPLHRSPNAGWPEAAMAVCLNISLSGPRSYAGKKTDFPRVFPEGNRNPGAPDIDRAVTALWKTWGLMLVALLTLALV